VDLVRNKGGFSTAPLPLLLTVVHGVFDVGARGHGGNRCVVKWE
jgi:hypothetical protein